MDAVTQERAMAEPTADELAMWRHVSWATAVGMYARRHHLDPAKADERERITAVFRAAESATPTEATP